MIPFSVQLHKLRGYSTSGVALLRQVLLARTPSHTVLNCFSLCRNQSSYVSLYHPRSWSRMLSYYVLKCGISDISSGISLCKRAHEQLLCCFTESQRHTYTKGFFAGIWALQFLTFRHLIHAIAFTALWLNPKLPVQCRHPRKVSMQNISPPQLKKGKCQIWCLSGFSKVWKHLFPCRTCSNSTWSHGYPLVPFYPWLEVSPRDLETWQ